MGDEERTEAHRKFLREEMKKTKGFWIQTCFFTLCLLIGRAFSEARRNRDTFIPWDSVHRNYNGPNDTVVGPKGPNQFNRIKDTTLLFLVKDNLQLFFFGSLYTRF